MPEDTKKPKGRMSSYAFFVQTCREEHKKKYPGTGVNFAEFSKKCSERWKTMSANEKGKFDEMAKQDKLRYDREMKDYVPPVGEKKKKTMKVPTAPKRPPSAFFVFCAKHHQEVPGEMQDMSTMSKDSGKPKGRMSSYAFFIVTCWEEQKKKHPDTSLNFAEFARKCSERWKTMSANEKGKFDEMEKQDKLRYEREMKNYIPPKGEKKKRRIKDPSVPKSPLSAFFVFCAEHRPIVKAENPSLSIGEIAKKLVERWNSTSAEDKLAYGRKAAKLKEKYDKATHRSFSRSRPAGSKAATAAKDKNMDDDDDDDDDEEDEKEEDDDDDDEEDEKEDDDDDDDEEDKEVEGEYDDDKEEEEEEDNE